MADTEASWVLYSEHMALVHVQHLIKGFFFQDCSGVTILLEASCCHISSQHLVGMFPLLSSLTIMWMRFLLF